MQPRRTRTGSLEMQLITRLSSMTFLLVMQECTCFYKQSVSGSHQEFGKSVGRRESENIEMVQFMIIVTNVGELQSRAVRRSSDRSQE
eukprot:COSAG02_NODE_4358_length_5457_cov_2.064390_4_plen_88_part_00